MSVWLPVGSSINGNDRKPFLLRLDFFVCKHCNSCQHHQCKENPNYKFATEILSEDGKVLGTWSLSKENRVYTSYNELSPNIVNALIATEDVRFTEHSGIDAKALIRAVVKRGLLMQKNAGGGSTLSQQALQRISGNFVRKQLLGELL